MNTITDRTNIFSCIIYIYIDFNIQIYIHIHIHIRIRHKHIAIPIDTYVGIMIVSRGNYPIIAIFHASEL